jgi:DNA-binding CsgD family transcriptional regulator/tetratricopeptide (TPR) repeat protein
VVGPTMAPVIVGRDVELGRIDDAFTQAGAGRPQLVLVFGEAGIGKTWLAREAIARARIAGGYVLAGSCLDIGGGALPYVPVAEALRGLARTVAPDDLDRLLGPARDDLAAIVPELAQLTGAGPRSGSGAAAAGTAATVESRPSGVASETNQARLFERFIGFLGRLGEDAPMLAVVDDVQWIDRASRDLLTFLVRNVTTERMVAILTCRMDDLPRGHPILAWLAELGRAPGGVRIDLGRLDQAAVGQMREAFTGRPSRADETARLWRRSEGNPLFVGELLDSERSGGPDPGRQPASLVEILVARVAGLSPPARRLLDAISIAGRAVDERLLALVVGAEEDEVARGLRQAIDGGVVVADPAGAGYRFRHELLREVVEQELLPGEVRALHERYGEMLAANPELADPSPAGAPAELAHHWARAGRAVEAYRSSITAAAAAEAVDAFSDALNHLERALDIEPHLPEDTRPTLAERLTTRRRAAEMADLAGTFDRAIELTREALAMTDQDLDPISAGTLHSRLGYLIWVSGDGESAIAEHQIAVRLVPETPPTPARARVLASLGGALMGEGRYAESRPVCEAAIVCAVAADAPAEESRARNVLGSDLVGLGHIDEGLAELRQAREIAQRAASSDVIVVAHHNLALNLAQADHLDEALAEARDGLGVARRAGLERRFGQDLAALSGDSLLRLGRWPEADEAIRDGLALAQRRMVTTYLSAVRARQLALQGHVDDAEKRLSTIDRPSLDPDVAAFVGQVRAEAALAGGRPEQGMAAAAEGLDSMAGLEDALWSPALVALGLRSLGELAEMARAMHDDTAIEESRRQAEPLVARATELATRASTRSARAWLATARGEAARVEGQPDVEAWRSAVDLWAGVPDPYQVATARLRLAEAILRTKGIRADVAELLRSANATAAALGAAPLQRDIEGLAGRARIALDAEDAAAAVVPAARPQDKVVARAGQDPLRRFGLSAREIEVLRLVAAGQSNGEIGKRLFITRKTAAVHVTHILDKLGVSNRVEAAMIAARLGLADEGDAAPESGTA